MKIRRIILIIGLLMMAILPLVLLGPAPAQATTSSKVDTRKIMKSVVQIVAVERAGRNQIRSKWSGSGTIVTPDGLILTNCHVALPRAMWDDPMFDYDMLIVALTSRSDEPPEPTFLAEVVQYDPNLDLAVIRVVSYLDGTEIDAGELNLPALPLGDSDLLEIGDALHVFGYPSIGGATITFTSGEVGGFTREAGIPGRAWIKTATTIAGGSSGGTAVNDDGELVGVPTQMGSGDPQAEPTDCRRIQDTNGDGVVDDRDQCIPGGGFINALRPVNLAKPMIEAANRGLGPRPTPEPKPTEKPTEKPTGKAAIGRMFFASGVNDYDQPVTVVDSFPTGSNEIYLFFDFENFQDGAAWQPVLIYEGEVYTDIWPASSWGGGPKGTWWISLYNEPLPDGEYEFVLYYDRKALDSATVKVGGKKQAGPTFSNLVFSSGGETGYFLPAGIEEAEAIWDYANMTSATQWSFTWYYEGEVVEQGRGTALPKASGQASLPISFAGGAEPGLYRLDLQIGGKLAATADLNISGQKKAGGGEQVFGPITFALGVDKKGNLIEPGNTFESGIGELYAFFDYQGMQDGWEWTQRWSLDGEVVIDDSAAWEGGESGEGFYVYVYSDNGLPDAEYGLELLVKGQLVQEASCTVGGGGKPTPTPAPKGKGVEIYGRITDADTNRGIAGAYFLVLQPGVTVNSFQWTEEEVYSYAETDRNGEYALSTPLIRGQSYSIIILADGYEWIMEDDVLVNEDLESPFELNIQLQPAQ